jgi:ElaB/YqjD/DUF883 family membrane-anchored ribosome-binding protein
VLQYIQGGFASPPSNALQGAPESGCKWQCEKGNAMSDMQKSPSWPNSGSSGRTAPRPGVTEKVGDALDRGKSGIADSAYAAGDSLAEDVAKLREDFATIQRTLTKFASEAKGEAVKTAKSVGSAMASEVGDVASQAGETATEYAAAATQQVKTLASEMENMARKNPLGTIGATLLVGIVIGMMSRGRA